MTGTAAAGKAPVAADASGSAVWTDVTTEAELSTHIADTTAVHGITDTSALVVTTDTRLAVQAAGTASIRQLGTGSTDAAAGNDARLSDSRAPSGSAGGHLTGTYPNPSIASGVVTPTMMSVPARPFVYLAGSYYAPTGTTGTAVTAGNNETRFCRLWLPKGRTVDRLGLNVTGAGSAGSTLRLGMYAMDVTTGLPDGLPLIDAGTIDGTSATFQEKTVSYAIVEGAWFWLCTTCQGASAATPTVTTLSSTSVPEEGMPMFSTTLSVVGLRVAGFAAGALPTATGATFLPGTVPRPIVRLT